MQQKNQDNTPVENADNWQFAAPIAPPRVKENITKNVSGGKFIGNFLSVFLESLEATLKGVLGQKEK